MYKQFNLCAASRKFLNDVFIRGDKSSRKCKRVKNTYGHSLRPVGVPAYAITLLNTQRKMAADSDMFIFTAPTAFPIKSG